MNSISARVFSISAFITILFAAAVSAQDNGGYMLSGSYVLERASSNDAESVIRTATRSNSISEAQRADLRSKLSTPGSMEIAIAGSTVTLRTDAGGGAAVFEADGVARDSQRADGTPVSVRASFSGQVLIIASVGGDTDYSITFTPLRGGRQMRVTRRVTAVYLNETVFAESIYDKQGFVENTARRNTARSRTNDTAASGPDERDGRYPDSSGSASAGDDGIDDYDPDSAGGYSDSAPVDTAPVRRDDRRPVKSDRTPVRRDYPSAQTGSRRRAATYANFPVPGGTVITGRLESMVTTRASQENDRFRIAVESPAEFRGALIEGYLTGIERQGKMTGRPAVTFNFESIVLRDGRRYDFAGVLQQVVDSKGEEISTNDEGEVTGKSRTRQTVARSGIGAGIGAIIGGLLGGGKGALIGASIGAGAGAGSMIPGGRDDLEIEPGARLTIRSTGPGT